MSSAKGLFDFAQNYLLEKHNDILTTDILKKYTIVRKTIEPNKIFLRLIESLQNANMKTTVISGSLPTKKIEKDLKDVLFNFDPNKIHQHYGMGDVRLFDKIKSTIELGGKVRDTKRSLWPQYCQSVLSAAQYFHQNHQSSSFWDWIDTMSENATMIAAMPLILSHEVHGLGYTLACDFLKEIGVDQLGKPDTHIRDVIKTLYPEEHRPNDYLIHKKLILVAQQEGVTPYALDKMLWLIGSGNFYLQDKKTASLKKDFLETLKHNFANNHSVV